MGDVNKQGSGDSRPIGARHGNMAANHTELQSGCGRTCVFAVQVWSNLWDLISEPPSRYSMTHLQPDSSHSEASPRCCGPQVFATLALAIYQTIIVNFASPHLSLSNHLTKSYNFRMLINVKLCCIFPSWSSSHFVFLRLLIFFCVSTSKVNRTTLCCK